MSANGVVYHHVGTGVTTSRFWCRVCDGYYGVPHDGDVHTGRHNQRNDCACAPCQKRAGKYPSGGIFMDHADYLAMRYPTTTDVPANDPFAAAALLVMACPWTALPTLPAATTGAKS